MVRSLVLDQSTTTLGFAVVEEDLDTPVSFGVTGKLIQHGRTKTPAKATLLDRLQVIIADLTAIIMRYKPEEIVVENTMYIRQLSGQTSHAMAAILATCQGLAQQHGLPFYMQNPTTIKKHFTGDSKADKTKIIEHCFKKWGIPAHRLKDDNHADALAAAWVWLYRGEEVRQKKADKKIKGKRRGRA